MENDILEQPSTQGSKEFGKFKDAQTLLKAYNNLEAEFTKKSQRLATLENETEQAQLAIKQEQDLDKRVDEFVTKHEMLKPFKSALRENLTNAQDADLGELALNIISGSYKRAEDYAEDSEFLNNYIYNNPQITERVVKDYVSKLKTSPIKAETNSNILFTPPAKPTNISEAGRLAKSIIKLK